MLTLPRVWAVQVVSIVTPVVDYWRVAIASHPDLTVFGCSNLGTVDCGEINLIMMANFDPDRILNLGLSYTSLWWTAFWSLSIPCTIMLTFPGVCTIQLIPVVAAVVSFWGVGVACYDDFAIFRGIKFTTADCSNKNVRLIANFYNCKAKKLPLTPFCCTTFGCLSIPGTIMPTLPGVWTMQVVSIITPVVRCWGVAGACQPHLTVFRSNKLRTTNCWEIQRCVIKLERLNRGIMLTSLWWTTFRSFSKPGAIMLAFPGVCTSQLISIITAVVSSRWVGVASYNNFAIFRGIKLTTANCSNIVWLWN